MISAPLQTHYRFALYGVTASGKTAILAALGMARETHPKGYGATDLAITEEVLDKKPDKEKRAIRDGQQLMKSARTAIENRADPQATPYDSGLMTYAYQLVDGDRAFEIELWDYSGELLQTGSDAKLRQKLQTHLANLDGLLILTPAENDSSADDTQRVKELDELGRALADLAKRRKKRGTDHKPMALLINKWDRLSEIDYAHPELEAQKAQDFLDATPAPPHRNLHNHLKVLAREGNYHVFPVSAFGSSEAVELADGKIRYRPKQTAPLRSFGLEDPFIWLAQRCDAIDVAQYRQANERAGKRWWIPAPWRWVKLRRAYRTLRARLDKSPLAQQLKRPSVAKILLPRLALAMITPVLLFAILEGAADSRKYRALSAMAEHGDAIEANSAYADWLQGYISAPFYRHTLSRILVLSRKSAREARRGILEQLAAQDEKRETILWDQVAMANNFAAKAEAAQTYLVAYPMGEHATEANRMLTESRAKQGWSEISQDYYALMDEGDLFQAGYLLKEVLYTGQLASDVGEKSAAAIKQHFFDHQRGLLESRFRDYLAKEQWQRAREWLDRFKSGLPSQLMKPELREELPDWYEDIDEAHDRHLYERARQVPTPGNMQVYLQEAPLGTMSPHVERYQAYLAKRTGSEALPLTLKIDNIHWGEGAGGLGGVDVVWGVVVNGRRIPRTAEALSASAGKSLKPKDRRRSELSLPFRARLNDTVELSMEFRDDDLFFDDPFGKLFKTVRVSDLTGRYRTDPPPKDDFRHIVQVRLVMPKDARQPNLPEWHN